MGSLTILDYDDTLLCSSYVHTNTTSAEELADLATSVITLLTRALAVGPVAIVSNANESWLQLSITKFY